MSEGRSEAADKDRRQAWRRIERGGGDALQVSDDFGRLALHAYVDEVRERLDHEMDRDNSADLTAMGTMAALQKLAHVQTVAAAEQRTAHLLTFAGLGDMIRVDLRQRAAQEAAGLLGLLEEVDPGE